jgi:ATP-dependent RNA helicase HelY
MPKAPIARKKTPPKKDSNSAAKPRRATNTATATATTSKPNAKTAKSPLRSKELAAFLHGIGVPTATAFRPDPFQLEAINHIANQGCDVLVTAPTGSGKTWIATEAIRLTLAEGKRAWYTSPLKALSNDKFRDFVQLFGAERVGILTGDRKFNPQADLIVATTEIYRNSLYNAMNELVSMNVGLVVLDEVHYLADPDRGVVWEESIIYSPSSINVLMLSATVGNAAELAAWVSWARHKPCTLVVHEERPVPLRTGFISPHGELLPLMVKDQINPQVWSWIVGD